MKGSVVDKVPSQGAFATITLDRRIDFASQRLLYTLEWTFHAVRG